MIIEDGVGPNTDWFVDECFDVDGVRYVGYQTLDELYERHIVSKIDNYEYVDNIQE